MQTTSRGLTIHYSVSGNGPPLLLVPGTFCAAEHWSTFGYTTVLERDWRVISVDPLGHGRSDAPHEPDAYHPDAVTADLVAVMDAEGVQTATVWGYSRGGWLACSLAARHPDRVEQLIVGCYAMHAHEDEANRALSPLAGYLRRADWSSIWGTLAVTDPALRRMLEQSNDPLAVAAAIEGSLQPTRFIERSAIRCPSTHYVGSDEWILEHVRADALELGGTIDVIADRGHIAMFFAATDTVLATVARRLSARP
jgi:pimeloyl-ACP methyl ester carboxylesterase